MPRSNTMPNAGSARRTDKAPSRGSNLKHAETQDSGYGSSSSPATPDMNGTSPPKYASATRYQIVDEAEEHRGHRTILVDPEDSNRRTRSPSREQQRPALSTSGTRARPSRAATAYTPRTSPLEAQPPRPSASRHESIRSSALPRESPHLSRGSSGQHERERDRKLYREVDSDEQEPPYRYRVPTEKVISSPRLRPQDGNYGPFSRRGSRDEGRDDDVYPGSKYRAELRNPGMGSTRPSVC
jgi:hypothetical protein